MNIPNSQYKYNYIYILVSIAIFASVEYLIFFDIGDPIKFNYFFCRYFWVCHTFPGFVFFIPYFFIRKNKGLLIIPLIVLIILGIANVLYFRTYSQLIPLRMLFYTENYKGISASVIASFRAIDITFLFPLLAFLTLHLLLRKKIVKESLLFRIGFFSGVLMTLSLYYLIEKKQFNHAFETIETESPYRHDQYMAAKRYGVLPLWWHQISIQDKIELHSNEIQDFNWLISATEKEKKTKELQHNVIIILVESFESWPINATFSNIEITPNINRLLQSENSFMTPNVNPNTSYGRSSDAQLIINTGLLPLLNGVTCFKYYVNTFLSLPKAFNQYGYTTSLFNAGSKTLWNHNVFAHSQGFESIISQEDFKMDKRAKNWTFEGLNDSAFYSQTLDKMDAITEPFFIELITLTSHSPFKLPNNQIKTKFKGKGTVCEYIRAINYVDYHLGSFINTIKERGIFDKTTIVITGDHEGIGTLRDDFLSDYKNELILNFETKCGEVPLIIINSPSQCSINSNPNINQIDIYPSILDLMNIDYIWRGLGKSCIQNNYQANNAINNSHWPKNRNMANVSDSIIRGDLFKLLFNKN